MRIKFKKLILPMKTDPAELLNNINGKLHKGGYEITNQTQNTVEFKLNMWRPGFRHEAFKKVDGGMFEIDSDEKVIVLSYYLSPVFEIIASCSIIIFAMIKDPNILFFLIGLAFMFGIRVMSVKTAGEQIMEDIQ